MVQLTDPISLLHQLEAAGIPRAQAEVQLQVFLALLDKYTLSMNDLKALELRLRGEIRKATHSSAGGNPKVPHRNGS